MKKIDKLVTLTMPNVKDMRLIKKYGVRLWLAVWIIKILLILFVMWFCIAVLGFHIGIGPGSISN